MANHRLNLVMDPQLDCNTSFFYCLLCLFGGTTSLPIIPIALMHLIEQSVQQRPSETYHDNHHEQTIDKRKSNNQQTLACQTKILKISIH